MIQQMTVLVLHFPQRVHLDLVGVEDSCIKGDEVGEVSQNPQRHTVTEGKQQGGLFAIKSYARSALATFLFKFPVH